MLVVPLCLFFIGWSFFSLSSFFGWSFYSLSSFFWLVVPLSLFFFLVGRSSLSFLLKLLVPPTFVEVVSSSHFCVEVVRSLLSLFSFEVVRSLLSLFLSVSPLSLFFVEVVRSSLSLFCWSFSLSLSLFLVGRSPSLSLFLVGRSSLSLSFSGCSLSLFVSSGWSLPLSFCFFWLVVLPPSLLFFFWLVVPAPSLFLFFLVGRSHFSVCFFWLVVLTSLFVCFLVDRSPLSFCFLVERSSIFCCWLVVLLFLVDRSSLLSFSCFGCSSPVSSSNCFVLGWSFLSLFSCWLVVPFFLLVFFELDPDGNVSHEISPKNRARLSKQKADRYSNTEVQHPTLICTQFPLKQSELKTTTNSEVGTKSGYFSKERRSSLCFSLLVVPLCLLFLVGRFSLSFFFGLVVLLALFFLGGRSSLSFFFFWLVVLLSLSLLKLLVPPTC